MSWIETHEMDGTLRTRWDLSRGICLLTPVGQPLPVWDRITHTSPIVDGEFVSQSSIGKMKLTTDILIKSGSWAATDVILQEMIEDVSRTHRLIVSTVVAGVTTSWRGYRPDISAGHDGSYVYAGLRKVTFEWPVLPHPSIERTGV